MTAKRLKRPRDPVQLGNLIVDLATGQLQEPEDTPAEKRARKAGEKGGPARSASLTQSNDQRLLARPAAARWKKH